MVSFKPVSIPNGAFIFCRYTLAIALWCAFLFRIKLLVIVAFLIFLLSAILKIKKAPLIVFYNLFLKPIIKTKDVILDEKAMRFVHLLGASLSFICLIVLYLNEQVGWVLLFIFAILKTVAALGYCPATKLHTCLLSGGGCCSFIKNTKC